jgi:spore germination cell wall hydrolase CwlJ-like protein
MTYDQWMACLCLWREARGSSLAALTGIWWVLQNRLASPKFPKSLPAIILQHNQFSSFNANDPNATKFPIPALVGLATPLDWKAFLDCQTVVQNTLGADPTDGALFYESLPEKPTSGWWTELVMTVQIGPFRFYKATS